MSIDLADMLSAFLDAEDSARQELPARLERRLRARAHALAPRDFGRRRLIDDVVSRTWELLLSKSAGSYDRSRSGPITYTSTIMRTAVRDIRSANMTVLRSPRDYREVDVDLTASKDPVSDGALGDMAHSLELEAELVGLGHQAHIAAQMIAYDGVPLSKAATRVGLSRFALKRQLTAWAEQRKR